MSNPARPRTLMIAGGGTGGHIYPAIAIAREFIARDPQRKVVFVGTEYGLEKKIVPAAGFPLEFLSVGGLKGKSLAQTLKNVVRLPLGFFGAWRLISKYDPDVVVGVGGYASGPALAVAALRRRPTMIHEQNAFPGLTNRILARLVDRVAVAFEDALPRLKREGEVTGNPIRSEFFEAASGAKTSNLRRLLIFGGSQGSRILNDAFSQALMFLARWKGQIEIVHQTGPAEHEKVAAAYRASAFPEARVVPYLDPMAAEMAAADLVISRAGAMTIGEVCAIGRAAVLVPFAAATNNHQEVNARVVERAGGAVVITERELTPEKLAGAVSAILDDPQRTRQMGEAARVLAAPDASRKIVDLIEKIQRN